MTTGRWIVRGERVGTRLLEAEITHVQVDGDLAWLTVEFPGGTTAVLKVCISEIEWRNQ